MWLSLSAASSRRGRRRALAALPCALALLALLGCDAAPPLASRARAEEPASDPLRALAGSDPLELARAVRAQGDADILHRLGEDQPADVQLMACRAAPWLREPLAALEPLAPLVAGRDAALAPAAAAAARAIAVEISADALARRERLPESLGEVRDAYLRIANEGSSVRADIRLAAGVVAVKLAAAGVPDTASKPLATTEAN